MLLRIEIYFFTIFFLNPEEKKLSVKIFKPRRQEILLYKS